MEVLVWIEDRKAKMLYMPDSAESDVFNSVEIINLKGLGVHTIDEDGMLFELSRNIEQIGHSEKLERAIFVDNSSFCIVQSVEVPKFRHKWMSRRAAKVKFIQENNEICEKYTFDCMGIYENEDFVNILFIALMDERLEALNRVAKRLNALKTKIYSGSQILFCSAMHMIENRGCDALFYDCGFSVLAAGSKGKNAYAKRIKKDEMSAEAATILNEAERKDKLLLTNMDVGRMGRIFVSKAGCCTSCAVKEFRVDAEFLRNFKEVL